MSRRCAARSARARSAMLVALLGLAGGCGNDAAPSGEPAPIVDEAHGFELVSPGIGWKLLGPSDAKHLFADARAAAISPEVTAVVVSERMPHVSLERYAGRVADAIVLDDLSIERREAVSLGNDQAWRVLLSGHQGALALRFGVMVAVRGERAWRMIAWGSTEDVAEDGAALAPAFDALRLRDGGASPASAAPDQRGIGWKLEGDTFESAPALLQVRAPKGWRLVAGDDALALAPDADVALVHDELATSVLVTSEPCTGEASKLTLELEAAFMLTLGTKREPQRIKADLLGAPVSLAIHRDDQREYLHGVTLAQGRCIQLLARYPIPESTRARAAVNKALGGIRLLSEAKQKALAREGDSGERTVGADFVIQHGLLRDFSHGVVWRMPRGPWQVMAGDAALRINRDALAVAENRGSGIEALLIADRAIGVDAAQYHERVVKGMSARMRFSEDKRDKTTLAEHAALVSVGEASLRGRPLGCQVITSVHDEVALQALVWGRPENMQARAEEVTRLLAGIDEEGAARPVERTTEAYRDRRLGFSLALPADWLEDDRTPFELAPLGSFVRWERQGRWIGVVALASAEADFVAGVLEQLLSDELGALSRGTAREEPTTLAGWPARKLSWHASFERVDAIVAERDGVAYALVAFDSDGEAMRRAREGFAFVPLEEAR